MPAMESAAAGASRSVGAAHRRLGRVGLLTPMRAAPPRGRGAGQSTGRTPPISEAISTARADVRGSPRPSRARRPQREVVNAANFRSDFNSARRERASGADVAEPGVAHVDRLARGARSAPSPAAAPRSPHPLRGLIQRSLDRPSAIVSPDPRFVKRTKIGDGRRPPGLVERSPERHRQPLTQCPPWNRRQPARAARSARRTGGWGGSVCSRRCAPRPLAAAARARAHGRTTPISAAISTARADVRGSPTPLARA